MRKALLVGVVAASLAISAPIAKAITGGVADGTTHANVGALVMRDASGEIVRLCSGVLISPTAFLTMAFCIGDTGNVIADGGRVDVTFDPVLDTSTSTLHPVSGVDIHPNVHWASFGNMYGVATLATPVAGITPAALPTPGLVDSLGESDLTVVGYGGAADCSGTGRCVTAGDATRRRAIAHLRAVNPDVVVVGLNASATAGAGVCFGDLGAPYFLGGSNVVVAISGGFAGHSCNAIAWAYRTDIEIASTFLEDFASAP